MGLELEDGAGPCSFLEKWVGPNPFILFAPSPIAICNNKEETEGLLSRDERGKVSTAPTTALCVFL